MTTDESVARSIRTPPRRRLLAGALAVVLVAGLAWAGWWWTHPRVLVSAVGGFTSEPRPVTRATVSTPVTLPRERRESRTIRVDAARVHYARNDARATSSIAVCRVGAGDEHFIAAYDVSEHCSHLEPLRPGTPVSLDDRDDYLVLTVTATRPGRTRVDRVDVTYSLGAEQLWRRGTQSLGLDIGLRAR